MSRKEAKQLTGDYRFGLSKNTSGKSNAEVEQGEYIQDNKGKVSLVEGKKHSQGGVDVILEDGERILTDYDKIPEQLANKIKDTLDIRVSKRDTYSTVIDKYKKKIGLSDLIEEETSINQKILNQDDPRIDPVTKDLNLQALSSRLEDTKEKKAPLLRKQSELFDILFSEQEKRKMFEGIEEKFFKKGGEKPKYQRGRAVRINAPQYQDNSLITGQHANNRNDITFGANTLNDLGGQLEYYKKYMPSIYNSTLEGEMTKDRTGQMQRMYNEELGKKREDYRNIFGEDSEAYRNFDTEANEAMFLDDDSVRGFDSKFGNFTSTRPTWGLELVTPDELKTLNDAGVYTTYGLSKDERFADIYNRVGKDLKGDHVLQSLIEEGKEPGPTDITPQITESTPTNTQAQEDLKVKNNPNFMPKQGNPLESLISLFPDSGISKPGGVLPHLKTQNYLQQIDTPNMTANAGLRDLNRSRVSAMKNMENLDPQSRALAALGLQSQTNDATVQLHSNVADANSKIRQANEQQNLGLRDQFQQRQNASAMDYEQKTYKAMDNNAQNWRRYRADKARDQRMKWNAINKINANNALNPDVQFYNGQFNVRPNFINENILNKIASSSEGKKYLESLAAAKKKTTKKKS